MVADDYREFVVESTASKEALPARRLALTFGACTAFTAIGFWMFAVDADIGTRIAAVFNIAFFGGGGLLAALIVALRPRLGIVARLRVDSDGITWIGGMQAVPILGLGLRRDRVSWNRVESLRIFRSEEAALFAAAGTRFQFECVGVVPHDLEATIATFSRMNALMMRVLFDRTGVLMAGPAKEVTASELLGIMETYRSSAA